MRGIWSLGSPLLDSIEVETWEESSIAQIFWDKLKEEGDTLSFPASPMLGKLDSR